MSRRFTRLFLLSVLLLTGEVWAIGLGDIKLDSALNEPLRAEIVLLSASPDELADLTVTLASAETFTRYGIDRPFYLQGVEFNVVNGGVAGSVVQIRSRAPITEPFLTFLVEATWASGRLLREYTVLLDPPTYAPPAVQQAPAVSAPVRSTPSDSGRIERQPAAAPAQQPRPAPRQVRQPAQNYSEPVAKPAPPADDAPYSTSSGNDFQVVKGQTLWGVARHLRPDSRLTMNQTMLAIYEANPDAFLGNINELKSGVTLRVPSADEIFQISRGDAFREAQRQHVAWDGGATQAGYSAAGDSTLSDSAVSGAEEPAADPVSRPNLELVPPDEDPLDSAYEDATSYEPVSREDAVENRIAELESADVPNQQSLIEIRDNELATLRQELADIRGEVYEPPVDDVVDDAVVDGIDDILADDDVTVEDTADAVADAAEEPAAATRSTRQSRSRDEGIVDKIVGFLTGFWGIITIALLLVAGGLFWFMRRGDDDDDDDSGPWDRLDSDDSAMGSMSATETLQAPRSEETIVVVEQDSGVHPILDDTVESAAADFTADNDVPSSGTFGSLEDTFSSETAVNLDQTDPIAEADFHMAYGLYDQAADLINGALESDPTDKSLMSKLCEVYFVWGNRDAFVGAATRLKASVGDAGSADWDKIVIMGQQIAADESMFAGVDVVAATKAVDLSFDEGGDESGALDMDFGDAVESGGEDLIDLGSDLGAGIGDDIAEANEAVDFDFDDAVAENDSSVIDFDITAEKPILDPAMADATAEMPALNTPTIEEQFAGFDGGTSELPALDDSLHQAISDSGQNADETAEINLDDLDLGGAELDETEIASLDDLLDLEATGQNEALRDTGVNEALVDLADETGKNPEVDLSAADLVGGLDLSDLEDSGMHLARDETGHNPMATTQHADDTADIGFDQSLLDATGRTQVLSESFAVETESDLDATLLAAGLGSEDSPSAISNDAETMLAPLDDDDNFDFAKTEALPHEAFAGSTDLDPSSELPSIGVTDVDLDLDDLTAALQVSDIGDTIEQPRDDATVEQPRPGLPEATAEVPTMALAPEDMSGDLQEARTMTEVGTKLDLARAYVDMGDPAGARSILEEVLDEGDAGQKQQAQQLLDSLPS